MRRDHIEIAYIVMHDQLITGDISALISIQPEIRMHGIDVIGYRADKRVFSDASARKAMAAYIHRVLSAWPDFLNYCTPELAAELQQLLRDTIPTMH